MYQLLFVALAAILCPKTRLNIARLDIRSVNPLILLVAVVEFELPRVMLFVVCSFYRHV